MQSTPRWPRKSYVHSHLKKPSSQLFNRTEEHTKKYDLLMQAATKGA